MPTPSAQKGTEHPALLTGISVSDLVSFRGKALEHWQLHGAAATPTIQSALFAALRRLPRARLVKLVFADDNSTWDVEQSSPFAFTVSRNARKPRRRGRPRLSHVDEDVLRNYQLLLERLQWLRSRIRTGRLVLDGRANLARVLAPHLSGATDYLIVEGERLSIRTMAGTVRPLKGLEASDLRTGQFVPYLLAREWIARLYGCSPATIRDRTTKRRKRPAR